MALAPNGEALIGSYPKKSKLGDRHKPPRLSMEGLQRAMSDISIELSTEFDIDSDNKLPAIAEVEEATCECCGACEQCTPDFIDRERGKFLGRLMCGICGEAVKEEMEKKGGNKEAALEEHMNVCGGFNRVDRAYPVLHQAELMREIFKKRSSSSRAKSMSPKERVGPKGRIARSSSCIPAILREIEGSQMVIN